MRREPVDWGAIKRHKRSHFAGAKVTMTLSSVGDEVGDTLAVLKNMYLAFRAERPHDHLSEYVVVCLTPGVTGDSPINETLQTAWTSLQPLGNKRFVPKIGSIRVSQEDVLSQTPRPAAQHVFAYQATPRHQTQAPLARGHAT